MALLFLLTMLGGITFVVVLYYQVSQMLSSVNVIENYQPREATLILSADGVQLARIAQEYREPVSLDQIPKHLINATIAKEDRRFWQHSGVDWRGTLRALWVNLSQGDIRQGGSTITQQLARNAFLTQQRTFSRKLQEIILAQEMERRLSKERILELYLNQVYYGSGAYGVKAAAKVYFNKSLEQLTLAECALLSALPQRPSAYEPFGNPDEAIQQRNLVLALMAREGFITPEQRDLAKAEPLRLTRNRPRTRFVAPYAVMDTLRLLEQLYGKELLLQGGLRVQTTIHTELQRSAERALLRGIQAFSNQGVNQGAIVLIDLRTGYIRALVGGVEFRRSQYNTITQGRRQPGSAFKPFVYATAFEMGKLTPNSMLSDSPIGFPSGVRGRTWRPQNADGRFRGPVSVTRALASSINIPAVRALDLVGPKQFVEYAHQRFGIESPLDPVLPLALGASAIRPIELAKAYSVFALGGNRIEPILVKRVFDREGAILLDQQAQVIPNVLSEQSARWIDEILRTAVVQGTGKSASRIPNARGKTGTTSDYRDAWFIGYTDHYLALVWVASEHYNPQTHQWEYRPMKRVFGGTVCARIWADLMEQVLAIDAKLQVRANPQSRKSETESPASVWDTGTLGEHPPAQALSPDTPVRSDGQDASSITPSFSSDSPRFSPPYPGAPEGTTSPSLREIPNTPAPTSEAPRSRMPAPPPAPLRPPETVTVAICVDTGEVATDYCPEVVRRSFPVDNQPKKKCQKHGVRTR